MAFDAPRPRTPRSVATWIIVTVLVAGLVVLLASLVPADAAVGRGRARSAARLQLAEGAPATRVHGDDVPVRYGQMPQSSPPPHGVAGMVWWRDVVHVVSRTRGSRYDAMSIALPVNVPRRIFTRSK